jgi:tripartite-type tricarboxylate transporter receptor subunit TctC
MQETPGRRPHRRLALAALAAVGLAFGAAATAQDFPVKPIRVLVPTPPGTGPDVDMRQVAARMGSILGQPVVIENRPGAGTRIAIEAVAKSPPDGYTLLVGTPSLVTAPALYANLPFDPRRDLVPVSLVSTTAFALTVNAANSPASARDFVAAAKGAAAPSVGTYGVGTIPHLAAAWFASASGADLRYIHYNTSSPVGDVVAGQVNGVFDAILPVLGNVKAGKLRTLAVSGRTRNPLMPDVPTFTEAGIAGYDPMVWIGILAPAGTPRPVVEKISAALAQVAKQPEIVQQRREGASESVGSTPDEFAAFLDAEREKWGAVIRRLGLKLE